MNKYSNNNPSGEWSRLMQQQYNHSDQQLQMLKQEDQLRKLQYRQELQTAMQQRNRRNIDINEQQYADQILMAIQKQDQDNYQKQQMLKQKEADFARYSLQQQELKKNQLKQFNQVEKQQICDQMNLNQQMLEQEKISKYNQKQRIIYDLNSSYKQMEELKKVEQEKIKQYDKQYMQEEINKQQNDDQQRKNFLQKIKQNYHHQNEYLLDYFNKLYQEKERAKNEIEYKIVKEAAEQKKQQDEQRQIIESAIRLQKNKETQNSILQQMELRKYSKQKELQQKNIELDQYEIVNEQYKKKDQDELVKKVDKQRQYRQELILQMEEQQSKKKKDQSMSSVEMKINQNYYKNEAINIGIVPGVYVDHNRIKQQKYLDHNSQKKFSGQLERQRNLSAYLASNEIVHNNNQNYNNISGFY